MPRNRKVAKAADAPAPQSHKPEKIMLGTKVRDQVAMRILSINTFMEGIRSALNVPVDWRPINDQRGIIIGFQEPPKEKTPDAPKPEPE